MINNSESIERKDSTVLTPVFISEKIYNELKRKHIHNILDIGCNSGALSKPFKRKKNIKIFGIDIIDDYKENFDGFIHKDFLETTKEDFKDLHIDFIISNPPFQKHPIIKKPMTELILDHVYKIFPKTTPLVYIVPNYFLTNSKVRIDKLNNKYNVTKTAQLHKDAFKDHGISLETAVLYFNLKVNKKWELWRFEKVAKVKNRNFKSITLTRDQKVFCDKHFKNFNKEIKKLIKERFKEFPI